MTGNEPAFPMLRENNNPSMPLILGASGLTKREWVATHILQGLCSNSNVKDKGDLPLISTSVDMADKLIEMCK